MLAAHPCGTPLLVTHLCGGLLFSWHKRWAWRERQREVGVSEVSGMGPRVLFFVPPLVAFSPSRSLAHLRRSSPQDSAATWRRRRHRSFFNWSRFPCSPRSSRFHWWPCSLLSAIHDMWFAPPPPLAAATQHVSLLGLLGPIGPVGLMGAFHGQLR